MTSSLSRIVAAACVTLLAGCAGQAGEPAGAPSTPEAGVSQPTPEGAVPGTTDPGSSESAGDAATDVVGTLGGDAQLEGGCLWLDAEGERYELQLPPGYEADTAETAIVAPSGETLPAGTRLRVVGEVRSDLMTVCQIGPVLDATSISPAD